MESASTKLFRIIGVVRACLKGMYADVRRIAFKLREVVRGRESGYRICERCRQM
jgi:hypothetical protein